MTLHEAIEKVLKEAGKPLTAREIADLINKDDLYQRGDTEPVPTAQIHARIKNYPSWFTKTGEGLISLAADRLDSFGDAVYQVLDRLRSLYNLEDISYLLAALFFYKRWVDFPELLNDYNLAIETEYRDRLCPDAFRSFYDQLKNKLLLINKGFDTQIIDNLFSGNQDLFREAVTSLGTALKILDKISFSIDSYPVNDFGRRFSELFTGSYANIKNTGEFATPESLKNLMVSLVNISPNDIIYNPAAGYFTFPASLQVRSEKEIRFFGEELNKRVFSLGLLNLIANGASIENAHLANSITSSVIKDESAAVVICNPPFNAVRDFSMDDKLYPFKSRNVIIYFLQLGLKKLKPGGEALMVIPENILFSEGGSIMQFRKYLVENNLVDSVISLPSGTFEPYSMVKSSILILKKDRPLNKILFLDADRREYYSKGCKNKLLLHAGLISDQFKKLKDSNYRIPAGNSIFNPESQVVQEDKAEYGLPEKNYAFKTNEDVRDHDFNLDAKRYFFDDLSNIVRENGSVRLVELKSILKQYRNQMMTCSDSGFPYMSISNLNADFTTFSFENYDLLRNEPKLIGQVIDTDVLMAGSIEGRLKPTFFRFTGRKILLSADVFAFIPDTEKADPQYLIYELADSYVSKQVKALSVGAAIRRIKISDFLRVRIRLPESIGEQHKIVNAKKEALVQARVRETEDLAGRLKISATNERKMLGAFKHELTPLASSLKGGILTLNKFLTKRIKENRLPLLEDKVSGASESRTLEVLMADLQKSANDLLGLSESIRQILDVTREDIRFENVEIKRFIKGQVAQWEWKDNYNIVFHGEETDAPDVIVPIIRDQFSILIRNFLGNTHSHGYLNRKEKYDFSELTGPLRNIVLNAFVQEDSVVVEMINDGDQFPADFTFSDFISFGSHGGPSKGSGIGGYLMNKIVENHGGKFLMLDPGVSLTIPQKFKIRGKWPSALRQIRAGVYFRIILHNKYDE